MGFGAVDFDGWRYAAIFVEFSDKRDTMLNHRQAQGLETFLLMNERETFQIITRELINTVRDRLQYIYLDMRRIVPNTREHDLMTLYLNFLAVEEAK
jgi:hypothetical protein